MQTEQVWHAVLGQLQMELPKSTFETWVRETQLVTQEDGTFVIGAPNAYARDWLENRLKSSIRRSLSNLLGRSSLDVQFVVWSPKPAEAPMDLAAISAEARTMVDPGLPTKLNPKYTFGSFVVGASNRLAHAACVAASENPAKSYMD